jgi:hypothetical protein
MAGISQDFTQRSHATDKRYTTIREFRVLTVLIELTVLLVIAPPKG